MIEQEDFAILDMRYKRIEDCDKEMTEAIGQHHALDNRLSVIETQQKFNNWLTALIAAGIVSLVIKVFIGG